MAFVISRIKGGLGNQLFCYAVARRLALANNVELVIDHVSGFARDRQYCRRYMLDHFHIPARKATAAERMEPFERHRRGVAKWIARRQPFAARRYLENEGIAFDKRILDFKVNKTLYLDGQWHSENYFKDVEKIIRKDLLIIPPADELNRRMAENARNSNSVALHVRWFDGHGSVSTHNASVDYYKRAIALIGSKIDSPCYYLFSDDPEAARTKLSLPEDRVVVVAHNRGDENAYADLWLMTQCKHFITANSTFSWWGAWLGNEENKLVVTPAIRQETIEKTNWGFDGLIPAGWLET
ncbi:MAG: glycosyl transferase family protein [Gammaproteobacteria bacterium]|nr:MAG: glycosyl transferase family protein [Gammaproteobacteria bacterium]TND07035.1 MAG: glycosyl transferase family protein [Gammaproteobacteria bacterium]